MRLRPQFLLLVVLVGAGDGEGGETLEPLRHPPRLCAAEHVDSCHTAPTIERWLRHPKLEITGSDRTEGTQGAKVLSLAVPTKAGSGRFHAKWRSMASATLVNDPRKELGAYAVQKLFLEPDHQVVPPVTAHCFPVEHYRETVGQAAEASFEQARCVFGFLSFWLSDAMTVAEATEAGVLKGGLLSSSLYERDPEYRRSLSNLNVLAHIIRHGDSHSGQFLIVQPSRHVYSVDNSIAFRSIPNPMLLWRQDWSELQVDAIPSETADELEDIDDDDIGALAVIEQLAVKDGQLVHVEPGDPAGNLDSGLRWVDGQLQVGLTRSEIALVTERVRDVARRLDSGALGTFE